MTVAAAVMVLFEVLSLAKGAISQYPAYSVARSNIGALGGSSCGLANDVLIEQDANASMLQPVAARPATALDAGGGTGFSPDGVAVDLTADGDSASAGTANTIDSTNDRTSAGSTGGTEGGIGNVGINGSSVALPFGLDPATTPVMGSFGSGTGDATSKWYRLPEPGDDGSRGDLISIAAAGRIFSVDSDGTQTYGQRLEIEFGTTIGAETEARGTVLPIDIGPAPTWRNLRVPLDSIPVDANAVRIVASDNDIDPDQWIAFTPPRVPLTRTLQQVVGREIPVLLDWAVGMNFPCQHQMLHRNGIAEIPRYRVLPDRVGAISTNLWQDHQGGGPLGWTSQLLSARTLPTYLLHDWDRDWGAVQQFTAIEPSAGLANVETSTVRRSGTWTPGPIQIAF